MQTIICFVLILTISLATDVDVYVYTNYEFYKNEPVAKPVPSASFIFGYHLGDILCMQVYLRNWTLNTTDMYLKYPLGVHTQKQKLKMYLKNKREKYYMISSVLNYSKILIDLELSTTTSPCTRKQIVKGKVVTDSTDGTNDTSYNNICLNQYCVIEVDLLNVFQECTGQPVSSQNAMMIYVIPSVIVTSVILLVIYAAVKKYCHHNARPLETIELNTYSTANEVVYADLHFLQGNSQPPRREEESPYAEIIGVLNPH